MKVYLFILSLFFCSITFAQNSISGTVTDENNVPVAGVNVKVGGESKGTITDSTGKFNLKTAKTPPFTVDVTSVGFASQKVQITSSNQVITVKLQEEATKLNEIVISASRTPERVLESPVTIERMGQQDIKNTTSATFYDGLENLKEVHFNTSSMSFKSINTRGFSTVANTRFMQLVDGMDNSSPALNFVLGNLIGVSEIDIANVELLPGASSALYGANAFNGIMFMNSKSPFSKQGITFYAKGGQTSQQTAGQHIFFDAGIRAAHAFSKKFAAKANFTFMTGNEWIASDTRDANGGAVGHAANPNYEGLNTYGDEASANLKSVGVALVSLGAIPAGAINYIPNVNVSRTGYREQDLNDNTVKNVKADFSFHYKPWENDIEIIAQHKLGLGNTIYQGANRYSLKDFFMNQTKFEIKGKNFFARWYMTTEDAGNSYDMRFAAINVNRAWKSDNTWFGQYAGSFVKATFDPNVVAQVLPDVAGQPITTEILHRFARAVADSGRFLPGSSDFNKALKSISSNPDLKEGAKFIDQTRLYHTDLNYNFKDQISFAEIQVGGSWRQYAMNSQGTIFTDFDGPIKYTEYGAYTQIVKKFVDDRLKFTGSARYDKSQNFKGFVSPRVALVYSAGESKEHNFRASFQTGFRNPTTQDQYIGLDLGPYALIGSAPENLARYTETRNVSAAGQALGLPATVDLTGDNAYNNSYTAASVVAFGAAAAAATSPADFAAAAGLLQVAKVDFVKPEKVQAIELGYRTVINKDLSVDLSGYMNTYNDFLSQARVISPYYGNVNTPFDFGDPTTLATLSAIKNGDRRVFQLYTNSKAQVTSRGFGIGLSKKIYKGFELSANYNYADFKFDQASDPGFQVQFNTPKQRVKASFGNAKLLPNLGFNVNVRWSTEYLWQSSFVEGMVPENTVVDAQVNVGVPVMKSVFKLGASNLGGKDYVQVIGAGSIGQQWFLSWTVNP